MYRKKVAPVTDSYKMKLETTPGKRKTRSQETECSPEKKECKTPRNKVVDALEKLTLTSGKKNSETRRSLYETRHSVSRSPSRGRGRPPNNLSLEPKFVILAETDGNLEMEVDENEENIPPPVKIQRSVGRVKKTPILELEPKETRRSIVRPRNVGEETKARFEEEQEIVVETRGKVVQASPETKYLKIKPILLKKIPDTCAYRISNTPRAPGKVQSQCSVGRVQKMDLDYNECESSSDSNSEDESSSASSSRSSSPLRKITRRMEKTPGINQAPKNLLDLRSLLHTSEVPRWMPCREEEHKVIRQFIEDGVKQNGVSQAMYISGVPGTGKTASTQAVVKELAKEFNFNYVTVNAMELMDPKQLFIEIYKRVVGEKKRVSAQAARIKLNSMFDKKDKKRPPVVILIDELDMLCTKKQDLLYDVFNWTSCEESRVSVLAIANTLDLPERVMSQRITSRLGTNRVVFQPYTHDQIVKIVQARLFKGSHLVHEQAIEFVSKKVANVSGDLRKAIDLLRRGMEIAVEKGEKRLLFEHVNAAQKESAATPRNVIGESLSRHAFLVFRSALCQVQSNGTEEFQFHELYKQYRLICNTLEGINPIHDYGIHHILMELCSNRLLVASPGTNFTKRRLRLGMPTHDALSIIKQVDDATKDGRITPLIFEAIPHWFRRFYRIRPDYSFPYSTICDLGSIRLTTNEISTVLSIALILTLLRYILEHKCKLWVARWEVFPRFEHKLPESIWKLLFYSSAWLFSLFVQMYVAGADSFRDPLSMWSGWQSGHSPPIAPEVAAVYALQAGYYLHSIYATLFMDLWRKDSWLMFFHHFIALALLLLSYVGHFVLPGVLLVFLHDSSDAALEMTKLGHYLKKRKTGESYLIWNIFGNSSFILFAILWIIFRLYFFSCKLLYATLYGAVYLGPPDAAFFPLLGCMLTMIFGMNIYWFNFILRMVVRVLLTGEDPEDNREFDTTAVSGIEKTELDKLAKKDR